jgi:hypothetical protein
VTDARLWHPWLRINRVLRVMLHTRWSAGPGVSETQRAAWEALKRADGSSAYQQSGGTAEST